MGSCVSKKEDTSSKSPPILDTESEKKDKVAQKITGEEVMKKHTFAIKPRKSFDRNEQRKKEEIKDCNVGSNNENIGVSGVRTSNCTEKEVDAILIQCGRLSRSSSDKGSGETNNFRNLGSGGGSRKYSRSKRSYDLEMDSLQKAVGDEDDIYRNSHRRTPSRDRDNSTPERKRSGRRSSSKEPEKGTPERNLTSRRMSRSPGRRNDIVTDKSRPVKMISVPAAVNFKEKTKISSPISKPSIISKISNENEESSHQNKSLNENSSAKAEQSPYRRKPMREISENCSRTGCRVLKSDEEIHNTFIDEHKIVKGSTIGVIKSQISDRENSIEYAGPDNVGTKTGDEEMKTSNYSGSSLSASGTVTNASQFQTVSKSRLTRRSRDLNLVLDNQDVDISTSDSLSIEDIQNGGFGLPPCLSKACSILKAVADLNSCQRSSFSDEKSSEAVESNNRKSNVDHNDSRLSRTMEISGKVDIFDPLESEGSNSLMSHPCTSPLEISSMIDSGNCTKLQQKQNLRNTGTNNNVLLPKITAFSGKSRGLCHRQDHDGRIGDRSSANSSIISSK